MRHKSRKSLRKNSYAPGRGDAPYVPHIPRKKVACFITLFEDIKKHVGNYEEARALVKMSNDAMSNMRKGTLTAMHAKRILNTYNAIQAEKANNE